MPTEDRKPAWRRACLAIVRCARWAPATKKLTRPPSHPRLGVLRSALDGSSFSQCERPRDGGMMTHGLSGRPQTPLGGGQLPNNALAPSKFLKAPQPRL
jgi:hypothetical protein